MEMENKFAVFEQNLLQTSILFNERLLIIASVVRRTSRSQYAAYENLNSRLSENWENTRGELSAQMRELKNMALQNMDYKLQLRELKTRIEVVEKSIEEFTCILCCERKRNVCLIPCSHGQYCSHCVNKLFQRSDEPKCPICRGTVRSFVVIRN